VSGWPAPFGITLVADALAVAFLALTGVVSAAALAHALVDPPDGWTFHPLFAFLLAGVTGAFLTGDVFNLFVWFEVLLMASYGLVAYDGSPAATRAALRYVVLNLVGSAVMLLAIGGLYATTGTLNMADLARRLAAPAAYGIDPLPALGLSGLLLSGFALKTGVVPFHFWVPAAYREAPPPVTAVLAGAVKKVGVYAICRLSLTVFAAGTVTAGPLSGRSFVAVHGAVLVTLGGASVLVGGLNAVGAERLDGVLAHSSVGQIGFVVLPVGLAGLAAGGDITGVPAAARLGVLAAVVYAVNHGLAKAALFLASGAVAGWAGTDRLADLGGLAGRSPPLAGAFLLGGLALVGVPPLTGFFGKLFVFDAALATPGAVGVAALAVALAGAGLTIVYYSRAWIAAFWGEGASPVTANTAPPRTLYVALGLAACVLVVGIAVDPLYRLADAAAGAALDTGAYVDAVDPASVDAAVGGGDTGAAHGGGGGGGDGA
jgi:multicomponent Na+:H+ antiporter subunit D